jgi:hypothetical protein
VTAGCGTLPGMADSEGSMSQVERALLALSEEIGRLHAGMNALTERVETLEGREAALSTRLARTERRAPDDNLFREAVVRLWLRLWLRLPPDPDADQMAVGDDDYGRFLTWAAACADATGESDFLVWVPGDESKPGDELFREAHNDRGPA